MTEVARLAVQPYLQGRVPSRRAVSLAVALGSTGRRHLFLPLVCLALAVQRSGVGARLVKAVRLFFRVDASAISEFPATTDVFRQRLRLIKSMPLFQRFQRADHPLIVQAMHRKVWQSGSVITWVAESDVTWIIEAGSAAVQLQDRMDTSTVQSLSQGEYFGLYNSLNAQVQNASAVAGPKGLTTLSVSLSDLQDSGVHMRCPRRHAIIAGGRGPLADASPKSSSFLAVEKTPEQAQWLLVTLTRHLNPVLGQPDDELLEGLVDECMYQHIDAGELLTVQDDQDETLHVVEAGSLSSITVDARSASSSKRSLGAGSVTGIPELLIGVPNTATLRAEQPSSIWILPRSALLLVLEDVALDSEYEAPLARRCSEEELARRKEPLPPKPLLADLQNLGSLGSGAFGTVALVKQPGAGQLYALKTILKSSLHSNTLKQQVQYEREVMELMDSDFIVRLFGAYSDRDNIFFLLEASLGGDLFGALDLRRREVVGNPAFARFASASIALALQHMHSRQVIYRDLKPENVLLDPQGRFKVCDFGLAKLCVGRAYTICGTPEYMAPEVLEHKGYGQPVDWWSLGVLTFEVICGRQPFQNDDGGEDLVATFRSIRRGITAAHFPTRRFSEEARAYVCALCAPNASSRLGAQGGLHEVKRHEFFAGLDFRALAKGEVEPPFIPEVHEVAAKHM